ncbi:immunoglobulin domain-containing protein [Spirosoma spitsbergense]|uniref:immunoglobulin domain-containing protein n=1 Tax=Spirosoma spitsbergense TaxID=431554 RepID=UPI000363E594|nr:T9SS type A sorting domain-containing protein [Spirosoma spitsbergense]
MTKSIAVSIYSFSPSINPVNPSKCPEETINLTASPGATGNFGYTWTRDGQSAGADQTVQAFNAGSYTVSVTPKDVSCPAKTSTITVSNKPKPGPPSVSDPRALCQNSQPIALTAGGDNLQWFSSDDKPIGAPVLPNTDGTGPISYKVTQTVNGCTSDKATITQKFIAAPPQPAVANTKPEACQNDAAIQLSASGSGTINWYDYQYKVLPGAPAQPTSVPPSPYTYYVSQSANGCESERVKIEVLIKAKSPAPGNATVDFCQLTGNQTLTINAQNPTWYTSTGSSIGSTAPAINTDNTSPQTYRVAQNTNGCLSDQSVITVNIKPKPSLPTVNAPATLCQFGQSVALVATGVSGSSLQWYSSDDKSISTPVPNTDGTNPINYKVTQTVNGCTSDKATVAQTFNPASDKPDFTPGFYCVGYPAEPLSARTQTQGPKWYLSGSEIPATTVPVTTEVKVFTYQLTQTQADKKGCPSKPVDVNISILATPVTPSVQSRGLCNNRPPSFTLDSLVSGERLKWYDANTGGTGSTTTPKPDVGVIGPKVYYVTQTNAGNCESPRATLTLTVYPIPAAPKGIVSGPVCQTSNQVQPVGTFLATPDTGGTLTWYWSDQLSGAPQPPTSSATAQPGTYTVAVAQTVNGCISTPTVIPQTINKAPDKPTSTDLLLCVKDVAKPLSATPAAGSSLRWYGQSEKDGTASTQPPQATPDRVKTEIYYVSQVDGNGCESLLPRLAIKLTVADTPPAPTIPSVTTACQNTNPITLVAGATASLIWKGTDIQDTTKAPTPPTGADRVFSYTITQKLGSCISPASVFAYTIIKEPDVPTAQASYQICIGQTLSLSATASPATNTLKWYTSQLDATNRSNALTLVKVPTDKGQTLNWYVTQTDPYGCQSKTVGQTVTVSPQSTAKLTGDDRVVYDDNLHSQDSTAIRIQFGGAGPWNVTFWDGKSTVVAVDQNPFVKWVHLKDYATLTPVNSQTTASFALQTLSGQCGAGSLAGATYTLTVQRLVTDIEPLQAGLSLEVLPNPAATTLQVEWQVVSRQGVMLRVVSSSGSVVWQASRVGSGVVQRESLPVSDWSAGQYYVQLAGESGTLAVRKLIKQ